jgi:hypothetical protein
MEDDALTKAVKTIDEMIDQFYKAPETYKMDRTRFMYQAYANWAIIDIKIDVLRHLNESPIETVEKYRDKMNDYSCETKISDLNFAFSIAYDVATDVLDCLLTVLRE